MCLCFKLFLLSLVLSVSVAWLLPERCEQGDYRFRGKRSVSNFNVPTYHTNIAEVAEKQWRLLNETYKDYKYYGVPSSDIELVLENDVYLYYKFFAAYKCGFYTHDPSLLSSVYCGAGVTTCKLQRLVTTIQVYTSSGGFSWGVKVTGKIGAIGGEATAGGTYSCAYTISKTTSDSVECVVPGDTKTLQLYLVQSDMQCQFGEFTFKSAVRNNRQSMTTYFSEPYYAKLIRSYIKAFDHILQVIDMDTVPDELLYKLKTQFPDYNPYTDLVSFELYDIVRVSVYYYDPYYFNPTYSRIIPFTGRDGNSVFQYACITSV